tara:strand:+ start:249 stop:497 length:249 start_codon:yes stop_codon:yes gene_type:complete
MMGCGCGKNKNNNNRQSSRMPSMPEPPKKVGNISVPSNMTPNQRRSTISKIKNDTLKNKRKPNIADYLKRQRMQGAKNIHIA